MGKKPETRLVNQILKALRLRGGWWVKIHGSPFQVSGIPDIIGCYLGRFVALEVKVPGGSLTPRQKWTIERIMEAGGIAWVVASKAHALEIIYDIEENNGRGK